MSKMQNQAPFKSTHHDLHDVIVSVLAVDQVDRLIPADEVPRPLGKPNLPTFGGARETNVPNSGHDTIKSIVSRQLDAEPMHETLDYVRIQIQKMYVQRQRVGFWPRAVVSLLLLSVLGFVFYFFLTNSRTIELSTFY